MTVAPVAINRVARNVPDMRRRGRVEPEDEDYAEEQALIAEDEEEEAAGGAKGPVSKPAGGAGYNNGTIAKPSGVNTSGGLKTSGSPTVSGKSGSSSSSSSSAGPPAAGGSSDQADAGGSPTATSQVTAWMRPDRIKFDGVQAPFVVPDGDDVTWYKIGEEDGATTIAAQQVTEITNYLGEAVTATIGDVMIFQDGAIAEAIGSVMPNGKRGELYNIIACNVQSAKGKCIMVDYDGRDVKETLSKIVTGSTSTVAVAEATAAPPALSQWAENVMVLNVATVTAGSHDHRKKRSQSPNRLP
ncbi:hypothetical protein P389DRAFT_175566 [Cystobasidium minutum MCA 4210]|uniref:uncharacterized protein n=1 Tax=Cystobasidium minutum MCA 4210 TaxID=1397322 RepID=UPI0034CFDDD6|eukprot:jgi/Rhomi1/175566/fgenesh1_kg.11_\